MKEKRELGLFDAIMMGLSGAIGFEIFVLLERAHEGDTGLGNICIQESVDQRALKGEHLRLNKRDTQTAQARTKA